MAEVKVLVEGYTSNDFGEEKTCSTISLIKDGELNIVVDPGVLSDQKILVDGLANQGLSVEDIDVVCITHSHIDHYRNIGMFPKAKILEYFGLWDKDTVQDWDENFTDDIKIIKTPGHNYDGITFLVKTDNGTIAVCGDVFWKEKFPEDDPYASDSKKLKESRKKVEQLADWIIPGHAGMYKVKNKNNV